MSRADEIFIANCKDILTNGVWDTDREVRPRWEDRRPAHTVKKFGIVNRYDLAEEFPILTLPNLLEVCDRRAFCGYGRQRATTLTSFARACGTLGRTRQAQ